MPDYYINDPSNCITTSISNTTVWPTNYQLTSYTQTCAPSVTPDDLAWLDAQVDEILSLSGVTT